VSARLSSHRACGKLILLGEHFVVHGAPALALPVASAGTVVSVHEQTAEDETARLRLPAAPSWSAEATALAEQLCDAAFARLGLAERSWRVVVEESVPVGSGLGSSAAYAVALIGALSKAAGQALSVDELRAHAHALERITHGDPSGIDDTVVATEKPIWFARGHDPVPLAPPAGLRLVLASTGEPRSTREAVARVRELRRRDLEGFARLCDEAARVVTEGRAALEGGEWSRLGVALDRNHALLQELGVSTPSLDALVGAARRAGALGAKLTGAGGGGFSVALVDAASRDEVAAALRGAGAQTILHEEILRPL
jgi:mevalonate kinase